MRISDWSSDVCSSDLLQSEQQIGPLQSVVQLAGMIFRPPHWRANASVEWQRSDITLAGVFTYIGGSTDDRIQPTVNVESFKSFDIIAKIGRASCRERGCTYV